MKKGIFKRLSLLLVAVMLLAVFSGCNGLSDGNTIHILSAFENQEIAPVPTEFTNKTGTRADMTIKAPWISCRRRSRRTSPTTPW